jgi:hypothetical protein
MGRGGAGAALEEDNDRNPWNGIYPYPSLFIYLSKISWQKSLMKT